MSESTVKNQILFTNLIVMFQTVAMQQMGKIKNPVSDKIERNLEEAQMSIDMIEMLETKTKGNISEDESKFLKNVLHELRLNYISEKSKGTESTGTDSGSGTKPEEGSSTDERKETA